MDASIPLNVSVPLTLGETELLQYIFCNPLQPVKAYSPIKETLLGIINEVNP